MKGFDKRVKVFCLVMALFALPFLLSACASGGRVAPSAEPEQEEAAEPDISRFLVAVEEEPDTVDFQCTTIHYTVAINVFDRLVEIENDADGGVTIRPSLAESWEVSEDGRRYTFHLRKGVLFSNGSPLTASDVEYTVIRVLTHPDSCNRDIAAEIVGADRLASGETDRLEGFELVDDYTFTLTLRQPFEAFLACLSMPGASILDEESTRAAGDSFGLTPESAVGTGPFILWKWTPGEGMLLRVNEACWSGLPRCEGLNLKFMAEPEDVRMLFESGGLDVLDLDEVGNAAEFFIHGDIYQERLFHVPRIAITYIALNQSVEPLNDVRVRKALQLSLNRSVLLDAVYSGRGAVENGIFPHGLYGYNPDLPEIPYDPDQARALLAEAGYPEGFDLTVSVKASSTQWEVTMLKLAVSMWKKIGVNATLTMLSDSEFMHFRKMGALACYTAMWTADFNDPDNFIYTFFGNRENTSFRSLCYPDEEIMARVGRARTIADPEARLAEYQELERIIVQEDAAWIPLFSRQHYYVTSERTEGIRAAWNGSVKNEYRNIGIK